MMTMIWRHEVERELELIMFMSPDGLRFQEGHDRTGHHGRGYGHDHHHGEDPGAQEIQPLHRALREEERMHLWGHDLE